jgi:hypothetical protein
MSQILDNSTYVYYNNAGVFTDFTANADSQDVLKLVSFDLTSTKTLYIGSNHTFNHKYFNFKTIQTGGSLLIKYNNGADVSVSNIIDRTFNFSQNGHVYFDLPTDWKKTTVNGKLAYWINISSSVDKTGYVLYTIKNIFSDDDMIKEYLPELYRYLPTSKTDFLYLHELSKNEIINDMKCSSRIDYEDQVKGDSLIVLQQLSCYKFLALLLLPMISDESIKYMYETFSGLYAKRMNEIRLSVDTNQDETITKQETAKVYVSEISRA